MRRLIEIILTILALTFFACTTDKQKATENSNSMLKLYKQIDNQLHYWETWEKDEKAAIVHWGIVGQRGQDKEVKSGLFSTFRKTVQKEIDEKLKEGYAEFDEDKMTFLEVEYKIDGFGTDQDLDKRHRLEDYLNELLGWTGLRHVDGGSIGSGTMEAGCVVVGFEIAKKVIEKDLKNTEFGDYSRIYRIDEE
jgi:predicted DNA-binding WGR domain protein